MNIDKWWDTLAEHREYIFGILQLDIANHSKLPGSDIAKQKTKENLHRFASGILTTIHGAFELNWPGDGGQFLFHIADPMTDYDNVVVGAIHLNNALDFFNDLKAGFNLLEVRIELRISCHEGRLLFSRNPNEISGDELNYFLKHERDIGERNKVTITEEVHKRLSRSALREAFSKIKTLAYERDGKQFSRDILVYNSTPTSFPLRRFPLDAVNLQHRIYLAEHGSWESKLWLTGNLSLFTYPHNEYKAFIKNRKPTFVATEMKRLDFYKSNLDNVVKEGSRHLYEVVSEQSIYNYIKEGQALRLKRKLPTSFIKLHIQRVIHLLTNYKGYHLGLIQRPLVHKLGIFDEDIVFDVSVDKSIEENWGYMYLKSEGDFAFIQYYRDEFFRIWNTEAYTDPGFLITWFKNLLKNIGSQRLRQK
jgi:hypothetical protein